MLNHDYEWSHTNKKNYIVSAKKGSLKAMIKEMELVIAMKKIKKAEKTEFVGL